MAQTKTKLPTLTPKLDFLKPLDTSSLKDQSALVTGGANGIGAGFATALAQAGAYVTVVDINEDEGKAVVKKLEEDGLSAQFVRADVRSFEEQKVAFASAVAFSKHASLDIVAISAGLNGNSALNWLDNPFQDPSDPESEVMPPNTAVMEVNLTGAFYTTHLAMHHFRRTVRTAPAVKSKQIVFISSLAGYMPTPHIVDYAAAKWGVRGMWRVLRGSKMVLGGEEEEDKGVPEFRTNLIAPTFVRTQMTSNIWSVLEDCGLDIAEVSDVVDAFLRIVTDEEVDGRAIAIAANKRSFDLRDDFEGLDGGVECKEKLENSYWGNGMGNMTAILRKRKTQQDI